MLLNLYGTKIVFQRPTMCIWSLISFRDRTIRSYMILLFKDGEFDDSQIPRTIRSLLDPSLLAH